MCLTGSHRVPCLASLPNTCSHPYNMSNEGPDSSNWKDRKLYVLNRKLEGNQTISNASLEKYVPVVKLIRIHIVYI